MRFSEKYGFKKARDTIQIDAIGDELRNSLWSVLTNQVWDHVYYSPSYGGTYITDGQNPEMSQLCHALWFSYFKKPLDTLGSNWNDIRTFLRAYFFECQWYEVYDFIEFVAQNFPYDRSYVNKGRFVAVCNTVLERELSGYRFVADTISPITNASELDSIDQALVKSDGPVRTHLGRALELLSDRESPDYRNSIKESISAVESLVIDALGEKGTLGQLVKKLENEIGLHPALGKTLSTLYGYTSDGDGIRHALIDTDKATLADAKFFLVVCSAFINFVQGRIPAT